VPEPVEIRQSGSYHYTYAAHEPIARVAPGQPVRIHCVDAFENKINDESQHFADHVQFPWTNPQTGPLFVEGAEAGDTLVVHIDDIEFTRDFAVTGLVPQFGLLGPTGTTRMLSPGLPERVKKLPVRDGRVWFDTWSKPVAPFMGTLGVAPKLEAINSLTPGKHGGNMDCPETCPGHQIHLPVLNEGALFFCGDGHALQGHGEIGGVACEIPVNLVCRFELIKQQPIQWPRVVNDTHRMVVGSARPLEDAVRIACCELAEWVATDTGREQTDVLLWLTQVVELRVGNVVDPNYSVVAAVAESDLRG